MPRRVARSRLIALSLLCLPVLLHAGEEPPRETRMAVQPAPPDTAAWQRLVYTAGRLSGSVTTTLTLVPASMAALDHPPYNALHGTPAAFSSEPLLRLDIDGKLRSLFGDRLTQASIWFDPGTGRAILRERIRPGSDGSAKLHRFGRQGATRLRLEPADSREASLPPAEWTRRELRFFPYDLTGSGCHNVGVPALLLYLVSRLPETTSLCVFQDDALYRVHLEPQGSEMHPLDYTVSTSAGTRRVSGSRRLARVALQIEGLTPGADVAEFELLELRGTLVIFMEAEHRLPVLLSGARAGAGAVTLRLEAASLATPAGAGDLHSHQGGQP